MKAKATYFVHQKRKRVTLTYYQSCATEEKKKQKKKQGILK